MDKFGLLKNEYVHKYFFGMQQENFWNWILGIIVPAGLAFLYVWILPRFLINPSYKREIKFKVDREIMKINEEKRVSIAERKKTEEESKEMSAKVELSKKKFEAAAVDPEIKWEEDYKDFVNHDISGAFGTLKELKTVIYLHSGRISDGYEKRFLSEDSLMKCDINGLTTFDATNRSRLLLTEKGKYFLREFEKETPNQSV